MTLAERLTAKGPKRILALDGGGIRGALIIGYLEKIEEILRIRHKKPDLLLSDYFDFKKLDVNPLQSLGLADLASKSRLESLRKMEVGQNVGDLIKISEYAAEADKLRIAQQIPKAFDLWDNGAA